MCEKGDETMWCVLDKDDNAVAYLSDEVEADCFAAVYYPEGRVEYRRVTITVEEDL